MKPPLQFVEQVHAGVIKVTDGTDDYFVKYASPEEIARTEAFSAQWNKKSTPDTIFQAPEIVAVDANLQRQLATEGESTSFNERTQALCTKAHPACPALHEEDKSTLLQALRDTPIQSKEMAQMLREYNKMSRMGLSHGDLMGNATIGRDEGGKLRIHLFDFDPMSKNPAQSDLKTLMQLTRDWSKMGVVAGPHAAREKTEQPSGQHCR